MPHSKSKVYKPENFRFATKAKGREPTLYFRTSHGSGRLRQQHKHGPKIQGIRKHTSHAFFPNKKSLKRFAHDFGDGMTRTEFRELRTRHGGRHTPTRDHYHFEATFTAHSGAGKARTTHRSGGRVVSQRRAAALRSQVNGIYRDMRRAKKAKKS